MLEPTDRRLLFELLRPPTGYRLSCAVGTTYSLDLLALLVTPLAFTLFDCETKEGKLTANPTALLESLRRYADNVTLFCQAGKIQPPTKARQLFGYLEQCVVEVVAPLGGVFHPKLWVLRFEPVGRQPDEEWPIEYRVLCPSRNLTFDRSWDTMLAIEGTYWPREPRSTENASLARMISRLPDLAVRQPATEIYRQHAELIAKELLRVAFEPPEGTHSMRFWPLGLESQDQWPFQESMDRLLVISPFGSDGLLKRLSQDVEATIISRAEELTRLKPETLEQLKARYTLDPAAESDVQDAEGSEEPVALANEAAEEDQPNEETAQDAGQDNLSGLHAKVYIADQNGAGHIWTGSANATDAAFGKNVEILVELVGKQEEYGVEAVLDPQNKNGLHTLLQPFVRPPESDVDEVAEKLERLLDDTQIAIAKHELRVQVETASTPEEELFDLRVRAAMPLPEKWRSAREVSCRPITLRETWQQGFADTPTATFQQLHFDRLTPFILFCVRVGIEERTQERQFVVNLPIQGLPDNRRERLLLSLLRNSAQLMRYLLFLLADDGWDARDTLNLLEGIDGSTGGSYDGSSAFDLPLLEPMLKALTKAPEKLDRIAQLVADLEKTPEGRAIIPPEFAETWKPIWEVRKGMQS
ncbi:MAG: phospholipase D family protein [Planctomycetaceae bacterium]|nr:phospholipase D family protein [Planctomycetaceae bacterium]